MKEYILRTYKARCPLKDDYYREAYAFCVDLAYRQHHNIDFTQRRITVDTPTPGTANVVLTRNYVTPGITTTEKLTFTFSAGRLKQVNGLLRVPAIHQLDEDAQLIERIWGS
jgi:hypothetical protein